MERKNKIEWSFKPDLTNPSKEQFIIINRSKFSGQVRVSVYKFIDKDTGLFMHYLPAFELTGCGDTELKSFTMLEFSVKDFFGWLLDMPAKKMEQELVKLGWKHNNLKTKQYSQSYIDRSGELRSYAVDRKVEILDLETA